MAELMIKEDDEARHRQKREVAKRKNEEHKERERQVKEPERTHGRGNEKARAHESRECFVEEGIDYEEDSQADTVKWDPHSPRTRVEQLKQDLLDLWGHSTPGGGASGGYPRPGYNDTTD